MLDVTMPYAFNELMTPSRYHAYYGGRGSGKSHSVARALVLLGAQEKHNILCTRQTQKSIRDSVKLLLDNQIEAMGLGSFYTSIQNEIRGVNGTRFIFSGLADHTADTIKSYENISLCWVEEAQSIAASALEILIPTIRAPGSQMFFTWNPRHQSDPVDRRFRGVTPPEDAIIRKVNWDENPYFPDELEQERVYDHANIPDRYDHIWEAGYEPSAVNALWTRQMIHDGRVTKEDAPTMGRIVVAVDPAVGSVSGEEGHDEHGIIVCGKSDDTNEGYVLDDYSCRGQPNKWATRAVAAFDAFEADAVVIERNQGGDMCRHTLRTVRPNLPIIDVVATRGKHIRAEPISALYAVNRIHHVGSFPELESQLCLMTPQGWDGDTGSPDRLDAMVWGFTELFPSMIRKAKKTVTGRRVRKGWMS